MEQHKAGLVACGFTQIHGLNYMDMDAPATRLETICLLYTLTTEKGWEVHHIDIKTAYLNNNLDEEVYMEIPEGFNKCHGAKVLRLCKALYGLKQAGHQWYQKLQEAMQTFGLKQTASDPHMFIVHKVVDGIKHSHPTCLHR